VLGKLLAHQQSGAEGARGMACTPTRADSWPGRLRIESLCQRRGHGAAVKALGRGWDWAVTFYQFPNKLWTRFRTTSGRGVSGGGAAAHRGCQALQAGGSGHGGAVMLRKRPRLQTAKILRGAEPPRFAEGRLGRCGTSPSTRASLTFGLGWGTACWCGRKREKKVVHRRGTRARVPGGARAGSRVAVERVGNWYWVADEVEVAGCTP
jgi:hypothetical protein